MRHILTCIMALTLAGVALAQETELETESNTYSTHVGNTIPESFSGELSEALWLRGRVRDLRRRADFFSITFTTDDVVRLQPVIHDVWIPALSEYFPEEWDAEHRALWTTIEAVQVDMIERANDRELTVDSEQEVMALADALQASASAEGNG